MSSSLCADAEPSRRPDARTGQIGKDDLVLDMGSGDGRIVITAAQRYGARGRGVEIDPKLVEEAKETPAKAGVAERTEFIAEDMFVTRIEDATVMTLYVLTASNLELRPRILKEMRPGSRVVSHQFSMGAWLADKHESCGSADLYMWVVPAPVAGTWNVEGRQARIHAQDRAGVSGNQRHGHRRPPDRAAAPRASPRRRNRFRHRSRQRKRRSFYRGRVNDGVIEPRDPPAASATGARSAPRRRSPSRNENAAGPAGGTPYPGEGAINCPGQSCFSSRQPEDWSRARASDSRCRNRVSADGPCGRSAPVAAGTRP
jgi:SAM-dependent methyltransferase